jgi:hypothetical protein
MISFKHDGYIIKPSRNKKKKYDVFKDGKFLLSYGDINYSHYKDFFGYYSELDHLDKKRRQRYWMRHKNDHIHDPNYPGYWSWWFLWN